MPVIHLITRMHCSQEVAFDLSRSIDLHQDSTASSNERAVAARTSGLIENGEEVTWEATHFGIRQKLSSRITAFEPYRYFRDSMVSGAFKRFDHDHTFEVDGDYTIMTDRFDYTAPFGLIGRVADFLFLHRYMQKLLRERNYFIKEAAESDHGRYIHATANKSR